LTYTGCSAKIFMGKRFSVEKHKSEKVKPRSDMEDSHI